MTTNEKMRRWKLLFASVQEIQEVFRLACMKLARDRIKSAVVRMDGYDSGRRLGNRLLTSLVGSKFAVLPDRDILRDRRVLMEMLQDMDRRIHSVEEDLSHLRRARRDAFFATANQQAPRPGHAIKFFNED